MTCALFALDGRLDVARLGRVGEPQAAWAPDGVALSRSAIRCETDAAVLCVPEAAVARLRRRHPEHGTRLQELHERGFSEDDAGTRVARYTRGPRAPRDGAPPVRRDGAGP